MERSSPRTQWCARFAGKWTESPEFDEDNDGPKRKKMTIAAAVDDLRSRQGM